MRLLKPGAEGWDEARAAWNLAVDQRPAAVAVASGPDDVIEAIAFAREAGLAVAPQATGHGALGLGPLDDALLLRTAPMNAVEVDAGSRRARVGAGVLAGELAAAAAEHGLAALTGSAVDVGVVGYCLGGGLGWLGRAHGLACNTLLAAELVTADGRVLRADPESEPDLFWALRGGGGAPGVVTAVEIELKPVDALYGGGLIWPAERGAEILELYRGWAEGVPDELTSVIRYRDMPPFEAIPEPIRGRAVISVDAALIGGAEEGEALVAPLRAAGGELMDTFAPIELAELVRLHGDPEQPVPGHGDGHMLRELSAEAAEALVAVAGPGSGRPMGGVELRHLGGALGSEPPGAGALATLDAAYTMFAVGPVMSPEGREEIDGYLNRLMETMGPWLAERRFPNFAERPCDTSECFAPGVYERLREVKGRYDPGGVFRSTHPVEPLDGG